MEEHERAVDEAQLEEWRNIQDGMKSEVIMEDVDTWQGEKSFSGLELVGGVDISFVKDSTKACVALVVCRYPTLEVVETVIDEIEMTTPYASGFLAFREVQFFEACLKKLQGKQPQVIMVDGNGILHQRGFGVACHLGVQTGIPCIGVAKKLMQIDGLEKDKNFQLKKEEHLKVSGDTFNLVGDSSTVWGYDVEVGTRISTPKEALKSTKDSNNPIFVSVGHKISLNTATRLVHSCCLYRVPEPVRQADVLSRERIRVDPSTSVSQ